MFRPVLKQQQNSSDTALCTAPHWEWAASYKTALLSFSLMVGIVPFKDNGYKKKQDLPPVTLPGFSSVSDQCHNGCKLDCCNPKLNGEIFAQVLYYSTGFWQWLSQYRGIKVMAGAGWLWLASRERSVLHLSLHCHPADKDKAGEVVWPQTLTIPYSQSGSTWWLSTCKQTFSAKTIVSSPHVQLQVKHLQHSNTQNWPWSGVENQQGLLSLSLHLWLFGPGHLHSEGWTCGGAQCEAPMCFALRVFISIQSPWRLKYKSWV